MTWRAHHINHFWSSINGFSALLFEQTVKNLRQKQYFSTCVLSAKVNPFLKITGQTSMLRKVCLSTSRGYQGLSGYFSPRLPQQPALGLVPFGCSGRYSTAQTRIPGPLREDHSLLIIIHTGPLTDFYNSSFREYDACLLPQVPTCSVTYTQIKVLRMHAFKILT